MQRAPSPSETRKLQQEWDRRLAAEGLGVLGGGGHWTFPGANAWGPAFVLYRPRDEDSLEAAGWDAEFASLADDPRATLFQHFGQAANELPGNYRGRRLILAFSECGYEQKAADACGVSRWRVRHAVKRFCADHGFDFGALFRAERRRLGQGHEIPALRDTRDDRHPPVSTPGPSIRARQHAPYVGAKQRVRSRVAS